jgi:hypothetical protein
LQSDGGLSALIAVIFLCDLMCPPFGTYRWVIVSLTLFLNLDIARQKIEKLFFIKITAPDNPGTVIGVIFD